MDIALRRLRNQHLAGRGLPGPAEVVRHLGAVQAQDYRGALWAVAQRCGIPTDAAIEAPIASGAILRTHVLRPTWHFVAAEDIRWMLAVTAPRVMAGNASRYRELGLDEAVFRRSREALEKALCGGRAMTRPEIAGVLAAAGLSLHEQRLAHILGAAELNGVICSGPPVGRTQTYALLEERVPAVPAIDPDEALAELAVRYFVGHGPAQVSDFTWWSSLTVAQVRRAIEAAGDRLATEVVEGRQFWFAPVEPAGRVSTPFVRLLPNYDEYVVAYRERSDYYDRALDPVTFRGGVMANIVTVDGRAAGNWRRQPKGRAVELAVHPWLEFTRQVWDAVAAEVGKLERHLELPVRLVRMS
ncbi:MAG: hypothetical protein QOK05_2372 [Chloroflexota bacterium]|nr:hypothetical protein [Chloroflexota bacterium]